MITIPRGITKTIPVIGPTVGAVGLALDVKEIAENATAVGAVKVIAGRIYNKCTPPELWLAGKCVMFVGGLVASVYTGGNPMIVGGTLSALRGMIKKI